MLKNVKSVEYQRKTFNYTALGFSTYQKSEKEWRVEAKVDVQNVYKEKEDNEKHFKNIECYTLKVTTTRSDSTLEALHCVVVKAFICCDIVPPELRQYVKHERLVATNQSETLSVPDIAVAAQITGETKTLFYNSLPLESECRLPLNFHGRFAVSPDRRSLRTDSIGGRWNRFLAGTCLPRLYFIFLERLIIWHGASIDPYKLWPVGSTSQTALSNDITSETTPSFWNLIHLSSRKLFTETARPASPVPMSQVIFDRRTDKPQQDALVISLVRRVQPFIAFVDEAAILNCIFDNNRVVPAHAPELKCFTPAYVRTLLQENSSEVRMNELAFGDDDLRILLEFIMVKRDISEIEGCRILRLQDGRLWKVQESRPGSCLPIGNPAKPRYFIDQEGYDIFKKISSGCLIRPTVLRWEFATGLTLSPASNVQRFDGRVVDRLIQMNNPRSELIYTYSDEKASWISSLYAYVSSRGLSVSSCATTPVIPVLKKNTFVSLNAWNNLRLMPPIEDAAMRRVCDRLPDFHILANLDFQPLRIQAMVPVEARLLQCLQQSPATTVEKLCRDRLDDQDLIVQLDS